MIDDPALYEFHTCGECGIRYAVPKKFLDSRREERLSGQTKGWWCPNGHRWSFTETDNDRLRRERDILKQQIARVEDDRAAAWRAEEAATAAKKKAEAALKRTMNRAGAGVCPCCNRSFVALARHMKTRHPDVVPMAAAKAKLPREPGM